jgi:hypothetical protein
MTPATLDARTPIEDLHLDEDIDALERGFSSP